MVTLADGQQKKGASREMVSRPAMKINPYSSGDVPSNAPNAQRRLLCFGEPPDARDIEALVGAIPPQGAQTLATREVPEVIAPSSPQLASKRSSGLALRDWTVPWCAWRVCTHSPRSTSHQRSSPSLPPLISIVPVGIECERIDHLAWLAPDGEARPRRASQTKSSPLPQPPPPLASRVPSGLHATLITAP